MPTEVNRLYSICLPAKKLADRTEIDLLASILEQDVFINPNGSVLEYFGDGLQGKSVIENDGETVTIYLTEPVLVNEKFLDKIAEYPNEYVWNIFHPHRYRRYEEYQGEVWNYVFLAPRETLDEISLYQRQRNGGAIVGKFLFSDWLFCCWGGDLELLEVQEISFNGQLARRERNKRTICLMKLK